METKRIKEEWPNNIHKNGLSGLIKFSKEKYAWDLYRNGTIHCTPIQNFKSGDNHQNDSYEAAITVEGISEGTIIVEHPILF
jgi:hypothetical protein